MRVKSKGLLLVDELPALFSPGFSFILLSAGYLPDKTRDGKRDRIVLSPYV
jgi:hypothetical protein